jgi:hypothetical protein
MPEASLEVSGLSHGKEGVSAQPVTAEGVPVSTRRKMLTGVAAVIGTQQPNP